jgi:hypothetical protein
MKDKIIGTRVNERDYNYMHNESWKRELTISQLLRRIIRQLRLGIIKLQDRESENK